MTTMMTKLALHRETPREAGWTHATIGAGSGQIAAFRLPRKKLGAICATPPEARPAAAAASLVRRRTVEVGRRAARRTAVVTYRVVFAPVVRRARSINAKPLALKDTKPKDPFMALVSLTVSGLYCFACT